MIEDVFWINTPVNQSVWKGKKIELYTSLLKFAEIINSFLN